MLQACFAPGIVTDHVSAGMSYQLNKNSGDLAVAYVPRARLVASSTFGQAVSVVGHDAGYASLLRRPVTFGGSNEETAPERSAFSVLDLGDACGPARAGEVLGLVYPTTPLASRRLAQPR